MKSHTHRLLVFAACLFIICGEESGSARASDYKNWQSPFFKDVKRAYIYVHHSSTIDDEDLPREMRRENIEQMMLDLYKKRFSPKDCRPVINYKNPYGCENQPVILVPETEASNFLLGKDTSFATAKELHDPGTLIAILRIFIIGNSERVHKPPLQAPLLIYQVLQDRPGADIPLIHKAMGPSAIPMDQTFKFYKGEAYPLDYFTFGIAGAVGR